MVLLNPMLASTPATTPRLVLFDGELRHLSDGMVEMRVKLCNIQADSLC